eukprot:5319743-Amphidinium_carterae.1
MAQFVEVLECSLLQLHCNIVVISARTVPGKSNANEILDDASHRASNFKVIRHTNKRESGRPKYRL